MPTPFEDIALRRFRSSDDRLTIVAVYRYRPAGWTAVSGGDRLTPDVVERLYADNVRVVRVRWWHRRAELPLGNLMPELVGSTDAPDAGRATARHSAAADGPATARGANWPPFVNGYLG